MSTHVHVCIGRSGYRKEEKGDQEKRVKIKYLAF